MRSLLLQPVVRRHRAPTGGYMASRISCPDESLWHTEGLRDGRYAAIAFVAQGTPLLLELRTRSAVSTRARDPASTWRRNSCSDTSMSSHMKWGRPSYLWNQ